jgi:hypothetical protein
MLDGEFLPRRFAGVRAVTQPPLGDQLPPE